ncbi:MAG: hypothetical protein V4710_00980 [Verrucomicrobiota bacterium]
MDGKSPLQTAFEQRRKSFEERLALISDTRELVRCADAELTLLEQSAADSLPVQDAKLLMHCLDLLRATLRTLAAVTPTPGNAPASVPGIAKAPPGQIVLTVLQLVTLAALATAPLGVPWLARLLIFLVVLLLLVEAGFQIVGYTTDLHAGPPRRLLALFGLSLPRPAPIPSRSLPAPGLMVIHIQKFCDQIGAALAEIDRIIATAAEVKSVQSDSGGLPRERLFLEFLQELLAASLHDDARTALKKTRAIPGLLLRHGFKTLSHDDVESGRWAELFEIFPNADPAATQFITEYPALVAGEGIALRGRLLEPAGRASG